LKLTAVSSTIFQPFGGAAGGVVPGFPGEDVISSIVTWFNQTPAIAGLFSDQKLWHVSAPENTYLPYATIFLASELAETWTTDYAMRRDEVQINVHAETSQGAREIAVQIRHGLKKAPLLVNNQPVMHVLPANSAVQIGEGLAPSGKDCWLAFETFDIPWTE
jgi:hypothetical protein